MKSGYIGLGTIAAVVPLCIQYLMCPLYPISCTREDLLRAKDRGIEVSPFWAKFESCMPRANFNVLVFVIESTRKRRSHLIFGLIYIKIRIHSTTNAYAHYRAWVHTSSETFFFDTACTKFSII